MVCEVDCIDSAFPTFGYHSLAFWQSGTIGEHSITTTAFLGSKTIFSKVDPTIVLTRAALVFLGAGSELRYGGRSPERKRETKSRRDSGVSSSCRRYFTGPGGQGEISIFSSIKVRNQASCIENTFCY